MCKLKCPFCNKKLEPIGTSGQFQCGTWGCDASFNFIATRDVWEYIGRTRKALEIAVSTLRYENKCLKGGCVNWETEIDRALEQIATLTKGDNNEYYLA